MAIIDGPAMLTVFAVYDRGSGQAVALLRSPVVAAAVLQAYRAAGDPLADALSVDEWSVPAEYFEVEQ